jgi:hypothetical protein
MVEIQIAPLKSNQSCAICEFVIHVNRIILKKFRKIKINFFIELFDLKQQQKKDIFRFGC